MQTVNEHFNAAFEGRNLKFLEQRVPRKTSKIGFLLLDNFSLPCFTQALDALATANLIRPGSVRTHTFSHNGAEVMSDLGIPIRPDTPLTDIRISQIDLMIVCGGLRSPLTVPGWLSGLLRQLAGYSMALGGLWNGTWYIGHAGLLNGYKCAIHPEQRLALAENVPQTYVSHESVVVDRNRLSAATPVGAFQVMIQWLRDRCDPKLAEAVIALLNYEQARFQSITPTTQPKMTKPLREVIQLMEANLEEPLEMRQISDCIKLSIRQIQRLFRTQTGTTPQQYYLQLRITEARRLLQNTDLSVMQVALACGFVASTHFSRTYNKFFGRPPSKESRYQF
ncbi:GlxA family transcriptional regulator [Pseudomonas sp. ABFPK]|uniref:GlxA family transcriptional regulator n=1 Tax=Pseudomonas sp. ABFPK TaxID=1636605 RepID=UPI000778EF09|nr:GlxA family transcriptional regulator [Pseudomonas sp. ABFPK]KYC17778.1 AraC family transcriptional regulator [Pseudomonas sp. ABFPK]